MPARLRACTRWSERTVRPSHTIFPYACSSRSRIELYRISSGASTPRSAKPEANTCVLASIRARRAAVTVPSPGLNKAQMWQFIASASIGREKPQPNHRDRKPAGAARGPGRRLRPRRGKAAIFLMRSISPASSRRDRSAFSISGAPSLRPGKTLTRVAEHRLAPAHARTARRRPDCPSTAPSPWRDRSRAPRRSCGRAS